MEKNAYTQEFEKEDHDFKLKTFTAFSKNG